jgi:hypothetical protein
MNAHKVLNFLYIPVRCRCLFISLLLIAACTTTPEETAQEDATPTIDLPSFLASDNEDASECSADGECSSVFTVDEATDALPLMPQEVAGIELGIPEGYTSFTMGEETIFTNSDDAGGFSITITRSLPERLESVDFEAGDAIQNGGWKVNTQDYGAAARFTTAEGEMIFIEGLANPGYWPAYRVTFDAILETVTIP